MLIMVNTENLGFFEALASEARIKVLHLLAQQDMNIKELAQHVGISSPIMIKHVDKLERAGIITTRMVTRNGTVQKLCTLLGPEYRIQMPMRQMDLRNCYETHIPVGHYTDINAQPTCGLATETGVIGFMDDPRFFMDPERMDAELLWFGSGFVEYSIPNYLTDTQSVEEVELSFEICSEAPGFNDVWPSDITFSFNGVKLCDWTSPGDFGKKRGVLTPQWWVNNQYGLLKEVRISHAGTMLDGQRVSDVTLNQVMIGKEHRWVLRFEVSPNARHVGGFTLFGSKFGNYNQGILVRTFYRRLG